MHYCKTPCKECPFTKTSLAGWLADYTPQELHNIVMAEKAFPCHMTHEEDLQWEDAGKKETPLCAGALRYMKKAGKLPRRKDLADLVNKVERSELENILSIPEFFEHHKPKFEIDKLDDIRSGKEIQRQIDGLLKQKKRLPKYSMLGTPNHRMIDMQISIIEGKKDLDAIAEGDWDKMDEDNQVFCAAEEADEWIKGKLS